MLSRLVRRNRPAQLQHRSSRQIGCRTPSSAMWTSRMLETFAGRSRIGVVERVRASSSCVRLDAGRHGCCLSACATITAHRERDAPGSARTRLRGLAHLPDELGPQLDLLLHSTWPAGRTAPEPPFLPGLHARPRCAPLRHPRKTQGKVSLASYRQCSTELPPACVPALPPAPLAGPPCHTSAAA